MTAALANAIRTQAAMLSLGRTLSRKGIVTGYDPDRHAAKVRLEPEGVETGWLPVGAAWSGPGFGLVAGLALGDLVAVEFEDGDVEAGLVGHRLFTDAAAPPAAPSGEAWLVHRAGQAVRLRNDGRIELSHPSGAVLSLEPDGSVHIQGDLRVSGQIVAGEDLVFAGARSVAGHVHGGVSSGTGFTQTPKA
jgi:phage baseplate assembly protein gpV